MADLPECRQQQQNEEAGAQVSESGPTHNPTAPPDEVFDISTTIDPSYIISLIRKLIPNSNPIVTPQEVESRDASSSSSKLDHMEDDSSPSLCNGAMTLPNNGFDDSTRESVWEESGTILWDLSANQSHAELLVENFILDVLLANLMTSDSARITEIILGIIGNLACHGTLMKQITSTEKLVCIIVDQVFSDDTQCLCEVCRVLTMGLQSSEAITWAKALQSDHVLTQMLWIAENTLNPILIEKSVGLLLAILENEQDVAPLLMPQLVKFGLPSLLVNLLTSEMGKLTSERIPERYAALDLVLRSIEAVSTTDEYSQEICSNKEVLQMASELIKLPDKIELENCCVTAVVLIANILTDTAEHAIEMAKDLDFIQGLFDLFPFTSDDIEARNALWSIIARLLVRVSVTEISTASLSSYVLLLVKKADYIEDDLLDNNDYNTLSKNHDSSSISKAKRICRSAALEKISNILEQWIEGQRNTESAMSSRENQTDDKDVYRLASLIKQFRALSTADEYSQEICSKKEVLEMANQLVKVPDKIERENCCVTAVVLIANILTDTAEHAIEMAKDLDFIQGLFDLFPFTSDDIEARNALWSIIARLLVRVSVTEISTASLSSYVLLLVKKADYIEDDLLDNNDYNTLSENHDSSSISKAKRICRSAALKKISSILEQWIEESQGNTESAISSPQNQIDDKDVYRLASLIKQFRG